MKWDTELTFNVHLISSTNEGTCRLLSGGAILFYAYPITFFTSPTGRDQTITSRQITTIPLNVTESMLNEVLQRVSHEKLTHMYIYTS